MARNQIVLNGAFKFIMNLIYLKIFKVVYIL